MTAETSPLLCVLMVAAYLAGAAGALAPLGPRLTRIVAAAGAIGGAVAGILLAAVVLVGGRPFVGEVPALLSVGGGLALRLDGLGAFFLILVGVVAAPAALYGVGYTEAYRGRYSLGWLGAMLNLFLLTMSIVVLADNALTFLLTWEAMSLTSYFLVMTEHERADTVAAGGWYLAMTHVGLALILAAFVLLIPPNGEASFAALRDAAATLSPARRGLVFVLAVLGFGGKAGLVPLHVWLPRAHPAAPSHVSALMSGVMVKLGVYGILRLALDLLGVGPAWWGALLIGLGAASALIGVLYALMEDDLKRLLAYSTVENVGLVFIGVGAGVLFASLREPAAAVLALAAALYHALNHGVFKGLLFLGAGSILQATGLRNLNEMGGLIRKMPKTAFYFLIGALAISALPPLNGFVSEWLTFQAALQAPLLRDGVVRSLLPLFAATLALAGALTAMCFVKVYGVAFLGRPRERHSAPELHAAPTGADAGNMQRYGMAWLAAACFLLGLFPSTFLLILNQVCTTLTGQGLSREALESGWLWLVPTAATQASYSPIIFLAVIVSVTLLGVLVVRRVYHLRVRRGDPWDCGYPEQDSRMQDTADAFGQPIRHVFGPVYSIRQHAPAPDDARPKFALEIEDRHWRWIYLPVAHLAEYLSSRVALMQQGRISIYLLYSFLTLIALLVFIR